MISKNCNCYFLFFGRFTRKTISTLVLLLINFYFGSPIIAQVLPVAQIVDTLVDIRQDSTITLFVDSQQLKTPATKITIYRNDSKSKIPKKSMVTQSVTATSYDVGEIPYSSDVNDAGAYTVNIPIQVPSGINTSQPQIALSYNSQVGKGIAGYGWNITGIPCISRRAAGPYHDKHSAPTNTDLSQSAPLLSLDGQVLIAVGTSGNFTEYYPEISNHIKVVLERSGGSILSIKAYYPNGSIAEFLTTSPDLYFPVSKITTRDGNLMEFSYQSNRPPVISEIKYGANLNSGTSHFASVLFSYKSRGDNFDPFEAGYTVDYSSLLDQIRVLLNGTEQRLYTCEYNNPTSYFPQLWSLRLSEQGKELPPISMEYGSSLQDNFTLAVANPTSRFADMSYNKVNVLSGRFAYFDESDGVVVYPKKNPWVMSTYNGINALWGEYHPNDGILIYQNLNDAYSVPFELKVGEGFREVLIGNMDNAAEDEIIKINEKGTYSGYQTITLGVYSPSVYGGLQKLKESTFAIRSSKTQNSFSEVNPKQFLLGDFNGDGNNEVFGVEIFKFWTIGSQSYPNPSYGYIFDIYNNLIHFQGSSVFNMKAGDQLFVGDFDGDTKTDIYHLNETGLHVYTFKYNNGSGAWPYTLVEVASLSNVIKSTDLNQRDFSGKPGKRTLFSGDFNGDAKTDVLISGVMIKQSEGNYTVHSPEGNWIEFRSNGKDFLASNSYLEDCSFNGHTKVHDMDGDGKSDIVTVLNNYIKIVFSTGPLLNTNHVGWYTTSGNNNLGSIVLANLKESDSKQYILNIYDKINKFKYNHNEVKQSLLGRLSNGQKGTSTTLTYEYIDANGYAFSKGIDAQFPYTNFYGHIAVVSNLRSTFGTVVTGNIDFRYINAVFHRQGLGFCGFAQTEAINSVAGQTTTRRYFPYNFSLLSEEETSTYLIKNTWNVNVGLNKQASIQLEKQAKTNKLTSQTVTLTNRLYNAFNNPQEVITEYGGTVSEKVNIEYEVS